MSFLRRTTAASTGTEPASPPKASGFWSFARLLLAGTVGVGVLSLLATLAGSAWLTANQRSEAEKPAPWSDPSFTTTAITSGGLISRWTDNDSNPDNGHSYIKGIYSLWKVKHSQVDWETAFGTQAALLRIPPLWRVEISDDRQTYIQTLKDKTDSDAEQLSQETIESMTNAVMAAQRRRTGLPPTNSPKQEQ